jgi:hypothetical protein
MVRHEAHEKGPKVPRKIVKAYISPEQKKILEYMCRTLGMNESEALRHAFLEYARSISLVTDKVHGKL